MLATLLCFLLCAYTAAASLSQGHLQRRGDHAKRAANLAKLKATSADPSIIPNAYIVELDGEADALRLARNKRSSLVHKRDLDSIVRFRY